MLSVFGIELSVMEEVVVLKGTEEILRLEKIDAQG